MKKGDTRSAQQETVTSRSPWAARALPGIVAALVHLVAAAALRWPHPHLGGDSAGYLTLARGLAEGAGYVSGWDPAAPPHAQYPPIYPLFLAGWMALGVESWAALRWTGTVLSAAAVGVATVMFGTRLGRGPATAMGIGLAVVPGLAGNSQWLWSEPLFTLLVLAGIALLMAGDGPEREERSLRAAVASPLGPAGMALLTLSLFTRSAGAAVVGAAMLWLLGRRRWRTALVWFASVLALQAAWTAWSGGGGGQYLREILALDQYLPGSGTVSPLDLVRRVGRNVSLYGTHHGPALFGSGIPGTAAWVLLLGFSGAGAMGRGNHLIAAVAAAWAALVLLWPAQFASDRFLLPLVPVLFLLAAEGARKVGTAAGRGSAAVVALALSLSALSLPGLVRQAGEAAACRAAAHGDEYACVDPAMAPLLRAARWAAANTREDAVFVSRKPRLFHAFSGRRGAMYPLTTSPDSLRQRLDAIGATHLVLDHTPLSREFLMPAVLADVEAYCLRVPPGPGRLAILGRIGPGHHACETPGDLPSSDGLPTNRDRR